MTRYAFCKPIFGRHKYFHGLCFCIVQTIHPLVLGIPHLYTAGYRNEFIEQREDYQKENARYYIYSDTENNIFHMMAFTPLEENVKLFYKLPEFIERAHEHELFTTNFNEIGLTLNGSRVVHYGIDKQTISPNIQTFVYDENADVYREIRTTETLPMFMDEIEKQIKYLADK